MLDKRLKKRVGALAALCCFSLALGAAGWRWQTSSRAFSNLASNMADLVSVEFEVFGRVQGVFFRKYTQQKARSLNLTGWCRNTRKGTVEGVVEGPKSKVEVMKDWLKNEGSPSSKVSDAVFKNEQTIHSPTYEDFEIKR